MTYSVKYLCKQFKLSRSALLYYDQIGLLKASGRSKSNYREYSVEDLKRMEQINIYRQAGLSLEEINKILNTGDSSTSFILEKRLDELNEEILRLREQQHFIIQILKNDELLKRIQVINKDTWISLLESLGFDHTTMERWHIEFENSFPEEHQMFLKSLGLPLEEINKIRAKSRNTRAIDG